MVQRNFNAANCPHAIDPLYPIEVRSDVTDVCSNVHMSTCNQTHIVFWDYCYEGCSQKDCTPTNVYKNGACINWYDIAYGMNRSIIWTCAEEPFYGPKGWTNVRGYNASGCDPKTLVSNQALPQNCIPIGSGNYFTDDCNGTYWSRDQCNCGDQCSSFGGPVKVNSCHNYGPNTWLATCGTPQ